MTPRTLNIAPGLRLPLEAVTETFGILAKRGAGKTYTAKVLVEELLRAAQVTVVIDPVGAWWGLRAGADGDPAGGFPITILGGDHADLPLEAGAGTEIADLVVDERVPLVLDLSGFRKGEARRFVRDFAERLYHRNRAPIHLVIDEADAFAPQRAPKGDEAVLLGAIEDLVRRGRQRGIGVTLVTQRAAVINKNVLTQVEVLIVLRTTSPQDRAAIDAWVEVQADGADEYIDVADTLPSLGIGDAWIWSPGWLDVLKRVHVRELTTFDSSATPKAGATITPPRKLATVDLEALSARMAASIERAKADDPKALRGRITDLERELARLTKDLAGAIKAPETIEVPVPVLDEELLDELRGRIVGAVVPDVDQAIGVALNNFRIGVNAAFADLPTPTTAPRQIAPARPAAATTAATAPAPTAAPTDGAELVAGARRLLHVIAAHPGGLTRAQAATLAHLKASGGSFGTYLSRLKVAGLVLTEGRLVRPTDAGIAVAGNPLPPSPAETLEAWRDRLGNSGARRMLDALVERWPHGLTRQDLGVETELEPSGGSFGTYLSRLRTNGLIEERDGELYATELIGAAA